MFHSLTEGHLLQLIHFLKLPGDIRFYTLEQSVASIQTVPSQEFQKVQELSTQCLN